jgi:hypothetical protein
MLTSNEEELHVITENEPDKTVHQNSEPHCLLARYVGPMNKQAYLGPVVSCWEVGPRVAHATLTKRKRLLRKMSKMHGLQAIRIRGVSV